LSASGQIAQSWDPATETLIIHHLRVIHDNKTTDILADGRKFLILRRENNLEMAMLDGRLTATIQLEGLEVGDMIDIAFTEIRHDPALNGHSTWFDGLSHPGVAGRVYSRALWPQAKPVRWRRTVGIDEPKVALTADGEESVVDMAGATAPKPPIQAPFRFQQVGTLEFTDFRDWAEVSSLMAPLYEKAERLRPDGPLQDEIAKIAAASRDPKVRAALALKLVEDKTRYLFLGLNDGGLVPAGADETWSRRFGDCKGKSVLLVAILRALGLNAQPALVSTTAGDGLDQRLPVPDWFDHVIVRVQIAGRIYWLDGTRQGDLGLDDLTVPNFHWALPIQPSGGALVALQPPPLVSPSYETLLRIDDSKGMEQPAPTHVEMVYRGELAVALRVSLKSAGREDYDRRLREMLTKAYPWLTVEKVDVIQEDSLNQVRLTGDGRGKPEWGSTPNGTRFFAAKASSMGMDVAFKREPGPNTDAPFLVEGYPGFIRAVQEVTLPSAGAYVLSGADVDAKVAGLELKRTSRIVDGVLRVEVSSRTVAPEFPAAEAEAAGAALRALPKTEVIALYAPSGAPNPPDRSVAQPSAAEPDADRASAQRGDASAQFRFAVRLSLGQGLPLDLNQARAWLRKSADQGYAPAEVMMGQTLMGVGPTGSGLVKDPTAALDWFRKAALKGDADGEQALLSGAGGAKDPGQALVWLRKAADQGNAYAAYALSSIARTGMPGVAPKDTTEALRWLRTAADKGLPQAQFDLGYRYREGQDVPADDAQALLWLGKAAEQGNREAQNDLGLMYEDGRGTKKDIDKALALFRKSADQNNAAAIANLARLYVRGDGVKQDYSQAFALYQRAADLGLPNAQAELGVLYLQGRGVPADPAQATIWLRKAADAKNSKAAIVLASLYASGLNVPKDLAQAFALYKVAADQGDAAAETQVGQMYLGGFGVGVDYAQAIQWLRKGADQRNPQAELQLGGIYAAGKGVAKDATQALVWYQKSADDGDQTAVLMLAIAYREGLGVAKDPVRSVALLTKAANSGNPQAQEELGRIYAFGLGVTKDYAQAFVWLQKASDQGLAIAENNLANLYYHGWGRPIDYEKAAALYNKAAAKGQVNAENTLGILYEKGWGVPQSFTKAATWYRKAADQGDLNAQTNLARLYFQGLGLAQDYAQAASLYLKAASQGGVIAERAIGMIYEHGQGVPADKAAAVAWLTKAAAHGDDYAAKELVRLGQNDRVARPAAEAKSPSPPSSR
jgi:TPR repeat protein